MWYPAELCSVGSDTPQDFVRQCIRPHRTLFCGVSDPTEQASAIKHTHLCHCSAGSDTPQDTFGKSFACINYTTQGLYYPCLKKHQSWKWFFVLRGMIPCGTTFEFEYLGEVEIEIENILEHESLIHEKNQWPKSRVTVPLRNGYCICLDFFLQFYNSVQVIFLNITLGSSLFVLSWWQLQYV